MKIGPGILLLSILLAACGRSSEEKTDDTGVEAPLPFTDIAPTGEDAIVSGALNTHFIVASDVPEDQKLLLRLDLSTVETWNGLASADSLKALADLLEVPEVNRESLAAWLKERSKYLIRSDLSAYNLGLVFPNAQRVGLQTLGGISADDENTGASNLGTALYMQTLSEQSERPELAYLILQINDAWVPLLSPRSGVIRIGPALFNPQFSVNIASASALSNSLQRIEVLFHEARHSDGNSIDRSLGFPHIDCPSSDSIPEELVGQPACDDALNGAYTVGAQVLRAMSNLCTLRCTARENDILRSILLDRLSRVVVTEEEGGLRLSPEPESGFNQLDIGAFQAFALQQ